jgi:hypothetical protein
MLYQMQYRPSSSGALVNDLALPLAVGGYLVSQRTTPIHAAALFERMRRSMQD